MGLRVHDRQRRQRRHPFQIGSATPAYRVVIDITVAGSSRCPTELHLGRMRRWPFAQDGGPARLIQANYSGLTSRAATALQRNEHVVRPDPRPPPHGRN